VDFYRALPPAGYTKGLAAIERTDIGEGDIAPEVRGRHFFPYKPYHLDAHETRGSLAHLTNVVQRVLASGKYHGAIWTQGSPRIEETIYWLNLLLDCTVPVCGNAAQRPHGQVSDDGARISSIRSTTSSPASGPMRRAVTAPARCWSRSS